MKIKYKLALKNALKYYLLVLIIMLFIISISVLIYILVNEKKSLLILINNRNFITYLNFWMLIGLCLTTLILAIKKTGNLMHGGGEECFSSYLLLMLGLFLSECSLNLSANFLANYNEYLPIINLLIYPLPYSLAIFFSEI